MHHHQGHGHPFAFLGSLEALFEEYLVTKAPFQLPVGAKEFLVNVAPYLIILFLILSLPAILMMLGMGSFMGGMMLPQGVVVGMQTWVLVYGIVTAIIFVMEAMALPGLFARTRQGRNWIYYAQVVSLVVSVLSGNLIGAILGFIIGMYILFQVRAYYK